MLTSFVLSLALAAPVPPATPAAPSGPMPKLVELKANADGKITVTVLRHETQKINVTTVANGGAPVTTAREVQVPVVATVELAEVKDLKITTADGKKVETADAVKALKGGAVVVVSADGKPVSPNYLKLFKDDVLVLAAPELAAGTLGGTGGLRPAVDGLRPQPLPAAPGGVQIQIQPGIQAIPLVPAVPVKPAPKPEK